ncbi:hypothetical protein [Acholeplasma granularum]|uniref:hypothetical protein n=1 Tax=Acholeplasma granularum TaxID=264635 RepID=UPI00046E74E4|nr:hypothetical protein [Acholeplasma granularum]
MNKNDLKIYILLSILPLIYLTNTLEIAIFIGLVYVLLALILFAAGLLINKFSEGRLRLYSYIILAGAIITSTMFILNTYFTLNQFIGIYLSITLLLLPKFTGDKFKDISITNQLFMVVTGFITLIVIGLLREVLATGALSLPNFGVDSLELFDSKYAITILKDNSGGFILSGFIFAIIYAIPFNKEDNVDVI